MSLNGFKWWQVFKRLRRLEYLYDNGNWKISRTRQTITRLENDTRLKAEGALRRAKAMHHQVHKLRRRIKDIESL